jgi:hypothetical protein
MLTLFEGGIANVDDIVAGTSVLSVSLVSASRGLVNLDLTLAFEPGAEQMLRVALEASSAAWVFVVIARRNRPSAWSWPAAHRDPQLRSRARRRAGGARKENVRARVAICDVSSVSVVANCLADTQGF